MSRRFFRDTVYMHSHNLAVALDFEFFIHWIGRVPTPLERNLISVEYSVSVVWLWSGRISSMFKLIF